MMPTGCARPISATAMPTKPKPAVNSRISRCSSPRMTLTAMPPASAPESRVVMIVMRAGEMPP